MKRGNYLNKHFDLGNISKEERIQESILKEVLFEKYGIYVVWLKIHTFNPDVVLGAISVDLSHYICGEVVNSE